MNSVLAAVLLVFNLITGAINPQECPPNSQWQWYEAHGIWACGGKQ